MQVPSPTSKPSTTPLSPASPIDVIYSTKTDKRSFSPPPKSLRTSFPSPPLVLLPNESKISPPVNVEDSGASSKVIVKLPVNVENKPSIDPLCVGFSSRVEVSTNSPDRDSSPAHSGRSHRRGRSRRSHGKLYTPPDLCPRRTLTPTTSTNKNTANLPNITFLTRKESEPRNTISEDKVAVRRTKFLQDEVFRIESALEHRVCYSQDPRLEDDFTGLGYARLHRRVCARLVYQVDWGSLWFLWH